MLWQQHKPALQHANVLILQLLWCFESEPAQSLGGSLKGKVCGHNELLRISAGRRIFAHILGTYITRHRDRNRWTYVCWFLLLMLHVKVKGENSGQCKKCVAPMTGRQSTSFAMRQNKLSNRLTLNWHWTPFRNSMLYAIRATQQPIPPLGGCSGSGKGICCNTKLSERY